MFVDFDFEAASAVDLKAAGAFRYAADASTRAIILSYAVDDRPAHVWHADGAMLDWNLEPDDIRQAFAHGANSRAWVWALLPRGIPGTCSYPQYSLGKILQ